VHKNQQKFLNTEHDVLINSKGFENTWLGRNENYKLFAVISSKNLLGKRVRVKVNKVSAHYLIGKVIE